MPISTASSDPAASVLDAGSASARAAEIRRELALGRWWRAAPLLAASKTHGDHVRLAGSWSGYAESLGVSERHANRLLRVAANGHRTPALTLREAAR